MSELVEWLRQQLDDDERVAHDQGRVWLRTDERVARWDRARVLREIAALRKILDEYDVVSGETYTGEVVLASVVRYIAAIFVDRPGFRPEWVAEEAT